MPLNGYTPNLPSDALLDTGIVMVGNEVIGVTRGAPQFSPEFEIENIEFDGKTAPIRGLDRKFYGAAKISGTLIEFGPTATGEQIQRLEAGISAAVDTGTTPNTLSTFTPKVGGQLYASGDYLTDVRVIFERGIAVGAGIKKYAAILFPVALVKLYGPMQGEDRKHVSIPFEIEARKDMASGTTNDAPYKIELRESMPT